MFKFLGFCALMLAAFVSGWFSHWYFEDWNGPEPQRIMHTRDAGKEI